MKIFVNYYLLIYFIIYYLLVFVVVSIRVKKQTGANPYLFKNAEKPQDYLGFVSKIITFVLFFSLIINAFMPTMYKYLLPIWYIENEIMLFIGFILLHVSLIWILVAQFQMDKSWRIGFDKNQKTELKTEGLFRYSRNPVFLGMIFTLFSVFLILPNIVTFCVFVVGYISFSVQIRLEEEYLQSVHGQRYNEYCKKVRRFI